MMIKKSREKKTSAAKQCIIEAQTTMSMEAHQSHVLKGGAKSGRTEPPITGKP